MFSPIVAIADDTASATVIEPALAALIASMSSLPALSATSAIIFTRPWKWSLRATKSVSELTSTIAPFFGATICPIRPSAATRPAFLAALDRPFLRSQSTAASMSPLVSPSAALQSIMPAPVLSRRSFTIEAVIVAMFKSYICARHARPKGAARRLHALGPRIHQRGEWIAGRESPAMTTVRKTPLTRRRQALSTSRSSSARGSEGRLPRRSSRHRPRQAPRVANSGTRRDR